jgi:hypothetical protein
LPALAFSIVVVAAVAAAQASLERQAVLAVRVLSFDKNLSQRAGESVVLLVLSKQGDASSEAQAASWVRALKPIEGVSVQGLPFRVQGVPYDSASLRATVEKQGADVLLVCDGLADELPAIRALSRERKLLTFASNRAFVQRGLSLAVVAEGERNVILVNRESARLEGAVLSSDLLKVAVLVD